jgi:acetylornithine/succinyldiaminopimelate/putrescine aminotransferase
MSGNKEFQTDFMPLLPEIELHEFNNPGAISSITHETAAVFMEPVQGEAGCVKATVEFAMEISRRCRNTGALLVFDEVQSGMGRTGSLFFFEQLKVIPDILLAGKALGGGLPLAAFISSGEIMKSLSDPPFGHITTFGGNPVCCAAGLAAWNFLENKNLIAQVREKEKFLRTKLVHSEITELRNAGLLLAMQLKSEAKALKFISLSMEKGLICDSFLFNSSAIRLAPPLTISMEELKQAADILLQCLAQLNELVSSTGTP